MGLTGKILLFIAVLVVTLVGGTLAFTTVQADRLARATIDEGLKETRDVWQAIQADRFATGDEFEAILRDVVSRVRALEAARP